MAAQAKLALSETVDWKKKKNFFSIKHYFKWK